jgi:hypothetical protein
MTQALKSSAWREALQAKLMDALDAAWAILEHTDDPAKIRQVRDKAKALGDLAALARKIAAIVPPPRKAAVDAVEAPFEAVLAPACAPMAAQAEHARRALDKLKGGRRGRI